MKVCFFGIYNNEYSRNRVLISGFKDNGYEVSECSVNPRIHKGFSKYTKLYREYKKIKHLKFNYVIVAFPGHSIVWLARVLFGSDIIFDAFVSLYNSEIEDRKKHKKLSFLTLYFWFLDWHSCVLAKTILLDTNVHIKYFTKHFYISKRKFKRVFVGTNPNIFYPIKTGNRNKFIIHFHGSYIPLQGIEYIVRAAKILENKKDIQFRIVGSGQEYGKIQNLARVLNVKNIEFINKTQLNELNNYINNSDICLGIFGGNAKANMVIPNKIYEAIACNKLVITAKTSAIDELFTDKENILLCNKADPIDIADKIMLLYKDINLRNSIAGSGYGIFKKYAIPKIIVKELLSSM